MRTRSLSSYTIGLCFSCLPASLSFSEMSRRNALAIFASSSAFIKVQKSTSPQIASDAAELPWSKTSLPHLSLNDAYSLTDHGSKSDMTVTFPMARWPDPVLRIPATRVPPSLFNSDELHSVARALRSTSRQERAVGLAAQQCGIDASIIYLETNADKYGATRAGGNKGIFLVNPRFVDRSSEMEMNVWEERCLVLPPSFRASVLRDNRVTVEAEDLEGTTRTWKFRGEMSRAVQHESDHDRGILILDHVGLEDMEEDMRVIEEGGHDERQQLAFMRTVDPTTGGDGGVFVARHYFVPPANAAESNEEKKACDEECQKRLADRRALFQQSKTTSSRQEMFDLSRQRAQLYNTTYRGATCPPGIPCL